MNTNQGPSVGQITRKRKRAGRSLWRLVRLLLRRKLWLENRALIAERYRAYAVDEARRELDKYFGACEWAGYEMSRNETLRRLLVRHHETQSLGPSAAQYQASELGAATVAALASKRSDPLPNVKDEPAAQNH